MLVAMCEGSGESSDMCHGSRLEQLYIFFEKYLHILIGRKPERSWWLSSVYPNRMCESAPAGHLVEVADTAIESIAR